MPRGTPLHPRKKKPVKRVSKKPLPKPSTSIPPALPVALPVALVAPPKPAPRPPSKPETKALRGKILCLLSEGRTQSDISKELGVSEATVSQHVKAHRAYVEYISSGDFAAARDLFAASYASVESDLRENTMDPKRALAILKAIELRMKVVGLEAPSKTELTGKDGAPLQIASRPDLSNLTDEELEQYERLALKTTVGHSGDRA